MTKIPCFILPLLLALAGLILFGQGAYIHAKALVAQVLLDRAFTKTIATGRATKPWSWADTWPVARIEVRRIHASAIVLAGSSGQALAFGPGHVEGTPDAGEAGVAVYSAHRDTHFSFLKNAQKFGLQLEGNIAHLIEKKRTAVGQLKASHALRDRPCKSAFFVSEQLAFKQSRRNGGAIHLDQGALAARA